MPIDCNDDHKKATMEFVKDCLAKEPCEPIVEVVEAPKTSDADVEQLKKQVVRQQKQIAALEAAGEEASDDADAFYSLLTHMNETDTHIFNEMMSFLKSKHGSVYDRQIKNFDIADE
jgi:phage-related minor tail protein